jgi:hypothetical protein
MLSSRKIADCTLVSGTRTSPCGANSLSMTPPAPAAHRQVRAVIGDAYDRARTSRRTIAAQHGRQNDGGNDS